MNLFINGSNRERNCFKILNDLKQENDKLISLSNKNIKYCLGCDACVNKLDNYCVLNDFMTTNIYYSLKESDKIIIASPLYMSNITGLLKNVIDRFNPFYHHGYFEGKTIYLVLVGQGTYEDNEEEINDIIKYFDGISEWMKFDFKFLKYFCSGNPQTIDDIEKVEKNYKNDINYLKEVINN